MTTTRSRLMLLVAATALVAACTAADSTAPANSKSPVAANRDEDIIPPGDSVVDASCRSGYAYLNGRACTG